MSETYINNQKIHYLVEGKTNKPPLILVHGIFVDTSEYKELFEILITKYRVYAFDLPGHGKSDKANKKTKLSTIVDDFISNLKLKNPTILGTSAGAIFAVNYASKNKNIKELILLNPAGLKYNSNTTLFFKLLIDEYILQRRKDKPKLKTRTEPKSDNKRIKRNIKRNIFNFYFWRAFLKLNKKDQSNLLRKIKCRTRLFFGTKDILFPKGYAKKYIKCFKNPEVHFIEGGHSWPRKNSQLFKKYL